MNSEKFFDIIAKTMRDGVKVFQDGENYQDNAVNVWRCGYTICVEDVCMNEFGSTFACRGYSYELTFAPSELNGIEEGYLGCYHISCMEEDTEYYKS